MLRYAMFVSTLLACTSLVSIRSFGGQDDNQSRWEERTRYVVYAWHNADDGGFTITDPPDGQLQAGYDSRGEAENYANALRKERWVGRIGSSKTPPLMYSKVEVREEAYKVFVGRTPSAKPSERPDLTKDRRSKDKPSLTEGSKEQRAAGRFKAVLEDYLAKLPPEERDRFKAKFLESLKTKGREQAKLFGFSDSDFDAMVKQAETVIANTPSAPSYDPQVTSLRKQYDYDRDGNRNSGRSIASKSTTAKGANGASTSESVAGTEWNCVGAIGYLEFRADGSGSVAASKGTAARSLSWTQSGNTVVITWENGRTQTASFEGGQLRIGEDVFRKR